MAAVEIGAGAVAVAGATSAAAMVVGGLMLAGGALSMAGVITGNKTLSQLGMVAGLAGGVGSIMSGAGVAAGGASGEMETMNDSYTAGSAATTPDTLAPPACDGSTAPPADASAPPAADTPPATTSPVSSGGPVETTDITPNAAPSAPQASLANQQSPADSGLVQSGMSQADAVRNPVNPLVNSSGPTIDQSGGIINQSAAVQSPSGAPPAGPNEMTAGSNANGMNGPYGGAPAPSDPSLWSQIKSGAGNVSDFINNNKMLTNAAGGIVTGAMKSASDQSLMKERYDQQLAYEQANRDRLNASVRGLAMPTYAKR